MRPDPSSYQNDFVSERPHHHAHPHAHPHPHLHAEYMNHRLPGYVSGGPDTAHENMRRDIEQSLARRDMPRAFGELNMLKHGERPLAFHRDLANINHDLHRSGILPHLNIVDGPYGLGMAPEMPQQQRFAGGPMGEPGMGRQPQSYVHRHENGQGRYGGDRHHAWGRAGHTYDGAGRADPQTLAESARLVGQIAQQMGVDPATAVAAMLVESGGNPQAVGDGGTSFGLFQLHRGGELGRMSPYQAFNPVLNTEVALSEFRKHGRGDPGMVAAAAQRPRNRWAYARMVDSALPEARRLLGLA